MLFGLAQQRNRHFVPGKVTAIDSRRCAVNGLTDELHVAVSLTLPMFPLAE